MDAGTGAILYAKNIDTHEYPASITKVLTAMVALENGKMDDPADIYKRLRVIYSTGRFLHRA